jgi:hypothetical protein
MHSNHNSPIETMATVNKDVVIPICKELSPEDIFCLAKTCDALKPLVSHHSTHAQIVWKRKFQKHFPHLYANIKNESTINWLREFKNAYQAEYIYLPIIAICFPSSRKAISNNFKSFILKKGINF